MRHLWVVVRWLPGLILVLLLVSSVLRGEWFPAILLALACFLVIPATDRQRGTRLSGLVNPLARVAPVLVADEEPSKVNALLTDFFSQ